MFDLDGKVALVTGAGTGIGRESVLKLAEAGASVVAADIDEASAQDTARMVAEAGGNAIAVALDVADEDQWIAAVARTRERFGGLDVLFNNAGIYVISTLQETTLESFNRMMAINAGGTFLGMKHTVDALAERGGGSIINMSSGAGLVGIAGHTSYGATKGAVRLMTKDVAAEFAAQNIRANSIHPTYVRTAMAQYGIDLAGSDFDEMGEKLIPLGRLAETTDVANLVVFLASNEAAYLTGGEYVVDGGGFSILQV